MQEAGGELLVSRILVQTDLPYRAMRVDLSHPGALRDPQGPAGCEHSPVQALRVERLAELAESLGADGLLLRGDGSMLGRSGLRRALRHLRACFAGWIALQTRGPDPADLQAVLADGLLSFADLQLAWEEAEAGSARSVIRTGPSLAGLKSILCRSTCPCVVRFTSPAEGEIFSKVSGVFDAFVRNAHEPVAVRVFEATPVLQDRAAGGEHGELLEFVACRPAWMLEDSAGEWLNLPASRISRSGEGRRS